MGSLPLSSLFIYTANLHRVNPEFYQVTQLRTDGVYYRESAGTGPPVVLKVVRVTGAAYSGITMNQLICASIFPHPLSVCNGHDDMCDTESIGG